MVSTLLMAVALAGGYEPVPELHKVPGPAFLIPCKVTAADAVAEVQLWVSADRGKSWQLYESITPATDAFTFVAKKPGEYWFAPRVKKKDGTHLPADVSELAATQRVAVATGDGDGSPPQIPLRPLPRPATPRDTADELDDELARVELDLIRKEIKRLSESNALTPEAEEKIDRLRVRLKVVRERTRPDPLVSVPSAWAPTSPQELPPGPRVAPSPLLPPPAEAPRVAPRVVPYADIDRGPPPPPVPEGDFARPSRVTPPPPPPAAPMPRPRESRS
jgi:hypothetical protein